jgi:uncharacterized membrane protein
LWLLVDNPLTRRGVMYVLKVVCWFIFAIFVIAILRNVYRYRESGKFVFRNAAWVSGVFAIIMVIVLYNLY